MKGSVYKINTNLKFCTMHHASLNAALIEAKGQCTKNSCKLFTQIVLLLI